MPYDPEKPPISAYDVQKMLGRTKLREGVRAQMRAAKLLSSMRPRATSNASDSGYDSKESAPNSPIIEAQPHTKASIHHTELNIFDALVKFYNDDKLDSVPNILVEDHHEDKDDGDVELSASNYHAESNESELLVIPRPEEVKEDSPVEEMVFDNDDLVLISFPEKEEKISHPRVEEQEDFAVSIPVPSQESSKTPT
jgi:hypothetical protein